MDFSLLAVSLLGLVAAAGLLIDMAWRVHITTAHHARLVAARRTLRERAEQIHERATQLAKAKSEAERRYLERRREHDGLRTQVEDARRRPGDLMYVTSDAPVMAADRLFAVTVRVGRYARNPVAAARFDEDRQILVWAQNANQAMSYAETRHAAFGEVMVGAALILPAERIGLDRWGA